MIYNEGYAIFNDVPCVYYETDTDIRLIPQDSSLLSKLNTFDCTHDFFFKYSQAAYKNSIAFIDHSQHNYGHSHSLLPKYSIHLIDSEPVCAMRITGPAIDEFFNNSSYFYDQCLTTQTQCIPFSQNRVTAETWCITLANTPIKISLTYGGIPDNGVFLQPGLNITFPPTDDNVFLFHVYLTIVRFLQFIQHNTSLRPFEVDLYSSEPQQYAGQLLDWATRTVSDSKRYSNAEYRYIKPYIQHLLQFSADNLNLSLDFLSDISFRYQGSDYLPRDLLLLFSAFEEEYKRNRNLYETTATIDYHNIKALVIGRIRTCDSPDLTGSERQFLRQAEERINSLGIQTGQRQKLENVMSLFVPVLNSSVKDLFIQNDDIDICNGLTKKAIKRISSKIVSLRSTVSHENSILAFNDAQANFLRFLELVIFTQMLKRSGLDDHGVELVLGMAMGSNRLYLTEYCSKAGGKTVFT